MKFYFKQNRYIIFIYSDRSGTGIKNAQDPFGQNYVHGGSNYGPSYNHLGGQHIIPNHLPVYNPADSKYPLGGSNYNPAASNYIPSGSNYNPSGSIYNNAGGNFNPSGSNYNPAGSNYNQGGSIYNPGNANYPSGSNYNPSGSNYNQGGSIYNQGGGFNSQVAGCASSPCFNGAVNILFLIRNKVKFFPKIYF